MVLEHWQLSGAHGSPGTALQMTEPTAELEELGLRAEHGMAAVPIRP